jgi:hypothetical protein
MATPCCEHTHPCRGVWCLFVCGDSPPPPPPPPLSLSLSSNSPLLVNDDERCVLFIGTRFSNLYTSVDTPARGRVVVDPVNRVAAALCRPATGYKQLGRFCWGKAPLDGQFSTSIGPLFLFITTVPITKLFAWGEGVDICYEIRRAEPCVDQSAHHALVNSHNACIQELLHEVNVHGKADRHMRLLTVEKESRLGVEGSE